MRLALGRTRMEKYLDLIAAEAERDMAVFHTTWVVVTVVPITLYVLYCVVKWYILLMPVTLPMTFWLASKQKQVSNHYKNN